MLLMIQQYLFLDLNDFIEQQKRLVIKISLIRLIYELVNLPSFYLLNFPRLSQLFIMAMHTLVMHFSKKY